MDISGNFTDGLTEVMIQYNKNIRDYNDNIRIYLEILQNQYGGNHAHDHSNYETSFFTSRAREHLLPQSQTPEQNQTEYLAYTYYPARTPSSTNPVRPTTNTANTANTANNNNTNLFNTILRSVFSRRNVQNFNDLSDVVVRPTDETIRLSTEIISFNSANDSNTNTSCPITLEPFTNGERVCRIKHCSHLFKQDAIRDWFQRNVRCPVCRYDIRDYAVENIVANNNESRDTEQNAEPDSDIDSEIEESENTEFDDAVQELLQESMIREHRAPVPQAPRAPRSTPLQNTFRNSPFANNLTSAIRNFVNNEINHLPFDLNSAAELLYTFDIPITLDISGNARI